MPTTTTETMTAPTPLKAPGAPRAPKRFKKRTKGTSARASAAWAALTQAIEDEAGRRLEF